jgi:chromosome segregation ATPase
MHLTPHQKAMSLIMISGLLVGCPPPNTVPTEPDPTKGNIFSSIYELGTGAYEERVTGLEAQRDKALDEQRRLETEQQGLQDQETQTQRKITDLDKQINEISENAHNLAVRIDKIGSQNTLMERKKAELIEELVHLNAKIEQLKQAAAQQQDNAVAVERHKEQARQLEQEVESLWKRYEALR